MTDNYVIPEPAELRATLAAAIAEYRVANADIARAALLLIAVTCTQHDPNRLTLEVEDSDQDDSGRLVPVINHTLEAIENELWDLCCNLTDSNKDVWKRFMQAPLGRHSNAGTLDLGLILTMTDIPKARP